MIFNADGTIAPETSGEHHFMDVCIYSYEGRRQDASIVIRLKENVVTSSKGWMPQSFEGIVFGFDEHGVEGFIPRERRMFFAKWSDVDMESYAKE